jgi:hypothetical protein
MVDKIGEGPTPQESYKKNFDRAVKLFQRSLDGYQQSEIPAQKEKFKDVMDKCLVIIHETIRFAKGSEKPFVKVDQDYQNYIANENPKTLEQLSKDLDSLS